MERQLGDAMMVDEEQFVVFKVCMFSGVYVSMYCSSCSSLIRIDGGHISGHVSLARDSFINST